MDNHFRNRLWSYLKPIFLAVVILPLNLFAQTYYFENYSVQQGLPNSKVYSVLQDKEGYIWIASPSGLSKFDGSNFTSVGEEFHIPEANVRALFLDSKKNLWVGYDNGNVYVKSEGFFYEILNDSINPKGSITDFSEDTKGTVIVTTFGAGAFFIHNALSPEQKIELYTGKEGLSDEIYKTICLKNGDVFFATNVDLKYLPADSTRFKYFRPKNFPIFFLSTSVLQDKEGDLWIGKHNGGLYKYNFEKDEFIFFDQRDGLAENFVSSLFQDSKGNIWVGTWGGGISVLDGKKIIHSYNLSNGLQGMNIQKITEDAEGNILIATQENGFSIFKGAQFLAFTEENGLPNNQIWAIEKGDDNTVWLGTNLGLALVEIKDNRTFEVLKIYNQTNSELIEDKIRNLRRDAAGNLWVGTATSGIQKFDIKRKVFIYDPFLNSNLPRQALLLGGLEIDSKNNLYIATVDGLINHEISTGKTDRLSQIHNLGGNDISALFLDSKEKLWVGLRGRGVSFIENNTIGYYGKTNGITPVCFGQSPNGDIWLGSYNGVYKFENDTLVKILDKSSGLLSDYVTLLRFDQSGNLYIGSSNGLNKYNLETKFITHYTDKLGFTGIETKTNAVLELPNQQVLFGATDGLMIFNENEGGNYNKEPFIHITNLKVNLKDYPIVQNESFSYDRNSFLFNFHGISLSNESAVEYQVMLEGLDEDWRPVTKQENISYSNLSFGRYTFKVRAKNNNHVWNKEPAIYTFRVRPPFWMTWWFIASVTIIVVVSTISFVRYRIYKLQKEKEILENKVTERTIEISQKNELLAEKNKHITDSINYAKRIQHATMRPEEDLYKIYPNCFILYLPKDIVSGDFYWYSQKGKHLIIAAADCTGHGVPGAFMSMLGIAFLNEITGRMNKYSAGTILERLRENVIKSLHQSDEGESQKDGMDIALMVLDTETNIIQFAGAYNPLYILRNNDLIEEKGDRMPIGIHARDEETFTNHEIQLEKGDELFVFTDGYADQFGGPNGKKLNYKKFRSILQESCSIENSSDKREFLNAAFREWRTDYEQLDDVLVIGVSIK